jgi:hypothetical protein
VYVSGVLVVGAEEFECVVAYGAAEFSVLDFGFRYFSKMGFLGFDWRFTVIQD